MFMSEPPQRVAIADLDDPASPMTGASVTVEGEVEETLGDQALTMRDAESDESLLVIVHAGTTIDGVAATDEMDIVGGQMDTVGAVDQADIADPVAQPAPIAATIPSSGPLRAIGTVDTFDVVTVEGTLGTTLSEDAFAAFQGEPYLLADTLETSFDPSTVPPDDSPAAPAAS
jgi:hypothetical protein